MEIGASGMVEQLWAGRGDEDGAQKKGRLQKADTGHNGTHARTPGAQDKRKNTIRPVCH